MVPLIFALLFAVIEYAYYLGGIHYLNYATFVGARALQVDDDPTDVAEDLLTGNMLDYSDGDVEVDVDRTAGFVRSTLLWEATTPGFEQVMGVMDAEMTVFLGPPECLYEDRVSARASQYSDNKMPCAQ